MKTVSFGVIGLRRGRSFVRMCNATGKGKVTALYDIDLPKARQAAKEIDANAYGELESFLEADFDAVIVASPVPFHATHSIAALRAGKHVLSEVAACNSVEEARQLVETANSSRCIYMMAENYRYLDEIELLKRMHDDNCFGDLYYGEGAYIHDCRELWYDQNGNLTWRGRGELSVYCTHSLGPLLYITGDRVTSVSALAVPGGKFDPRVTFPTMHLMQMVTARGLTLHVRVDHVSPRPHQAAYYALQGTRGAYEAWRGLGDRSKVWLEDEQGPSRFSRPAEWHALDEQAPRYIDDRLSAPGEAREGGHGTSEYWLLKDFLAALSGEIDPPIDVHRALDYTTPGISAVASAEQNGAPVSVPDSRDW